MKTVLSLGDSIAFGYRKHLIAALGDGFEVFSKKGDAEAAKDLNIPVGANMGDSRGTLTYLRFAAENGLLDRDFITINCGLHDIKFNLDTGEIQVGIEEYESNLNEIALILKATGAKVWFVNSTPVYDHVHNTPERIVINRNIVRYARDLQAYNAVAEKVMAKHQIPVIDLYSFTLAFGEEAVRDHVHYYPEYEEKQGKYIAGLILENI